MRFLKRYRSLYFLLILLSLQIACVQQAREEQSTSTIKIRESSSPASINPFYIRDEIGFYLAGQIFQPLLAIDHKSEELVGVLAESRPTISSSEEWAMIIQYELRENASFSDGSPLSFKDILYSIKANICPLINPYYNNYYQFIDSLAVDENDSSLFTFYSKEKYYLSEFTSGDYYIVAESQFDPELVLRNYSLDQLKKIQSDEDDPKIAVYSQFIQSLTFRSDSIKPLGSGAYSLGEWNSEDKISLSKKADWWGSKIQPNTFYVSKAEKLDFYFIEDVTTSLNALKNSEFDLMRSIPAKDFIALKENNDFKEKFKLQTASKFGFQYLGFNLRQEHLKYLDLRKAIAYSVPQREIIEKLYYGQAESIVSFDGDEEKDYNNYQANTDSASFYKERFDALNSNSNIKLTYAYNAGNDNRKAIGLILQEALKKINIDLSIEQYEWSVYLQKLKAGELDLFLNGFGSSSITPDLTNTLHGRSMNGGRNYFGYNDSISNNLLEQITVELDDQKRDKLYEELKLRVNRQLPLLVLMRPYDLMAFSKELKNANSYRLSPNYWAAEMSK